MNTWNYRDEYEKLLETLAKDSRPWRPVFNIPKDGTKIYFKCGVDHKGETQYDVGRWEDWRLTYYQNDNLDGEWTTEFGNCDEILGWKYVEHSL